MVGRPLDLKLRLRFTTTDKICIGCLVIVALPGLVIYQSCRATVKGAKRLSRALKARRRKVQETLDGLRQRECPVCLQDVRVSNFVHNAVCAHSLCRDCWKGYLETDAENRARVMKRNLQPLVCPVCMEAGQTTPVGDWVLSMFAPLALLEAGRDVQLRKR